MGVCQNEGRDDRRKIFKRFECGRIVIELDLVREMDWINDNL